ncbi:fluoride efflux transporter FluC [Halosegnis marinus]|uniref:Fluoride-specific ion channel FluC n=2 Tax=Halosegnis marinus TaxID=3034023 RepID=A0ABD5ZNR4_9EURY|nr:CrcB family protein [Halosegnis sp. DT85]
MAVVIPLFVAVGGAAGAVCRHLVSERVERATADTLAVNTLGSLILGVVLAAPVGDAAALALGTGFCGAFTTFSSFAFETVRLAEDGFVRAATRNAVATLALALLGVTVGGLLGGLF